MLRMGNIFFINAVSAQHFPQLGRICNPPQLYGGFVTHSKQEYVLLMDYQS